MNGASLSRLGIIGLAALGALTLSNGAAQAEITLFAKGTIAGSAIDGSGLTDVLGDGTPHNRAGGFGSAITYTGVGNRFLATPDRGPADGTVNYLDRMYTLDIPMTPGTLTPRLTATVMLKNGEGDNLSGFSALFNSENPADALRFDPEGVRVGFNRKIYISDEYGPYLYEFDGTGVRTRAIKLPDSFSISAPSADPSVELSGNSSGRQVNRGMECLAISPDGTKLYGMMQNALIQDHALDSSLKRIGRYNRIVEVDLRTGATRQFAYKLEDKGYGVNELLAINDHQLLALERDGKAGSSAGFKRIYTIDLTGATDISGVASLPEKGDLPVGYTPVTKTQFVNLLDSRFGLAGAAFPEKIEGLAFGPDLADGRHTLLVTSDNDFSVTQPTDIWAFAIDATDLPGFQPQQFQTTLDDVSSQVRVVSSGFIYNRAKKLYFGNVTVTNTSAAILEGALYLSLANLPEGITQVADLGDRQFPGYLKVTTNGMKPGDTVVVPVQLSNPSNKRITFTPSIYRQTEATAAGFGVFSDPHLYDGAALGTTGADFEQYLAGDRKLIVESQEILDVVLAQLQQSNLDFVLVSGDLTKDGERINHQLLADKLAVLKKSGKKVFVIPGNHDINNPHALNYHTSPPQHEEMVDPAQFKQIYAQAGYSDAISTDPASLSFIAEPVPGVWLFALDSCKYDTNLSDEYPFTGGQYSSATLSWIVDKLNEARARGKRVVGMQHHGALEHFAGQSLQFPEYVLTNWQETAQTFAENGLNLVFTGHFHANDVTTCAIGTTSLTDVETGSLVTSPVPYRVVDYTAANNSYAITTKRVTSIPSHPTDFTAYAQSYLMTGLNGLTAYQLSQPPYNLSGAALNYVAPLVAAGLGAHYAGDETPDAATQAAYLGLMNSANPLQVMLGQSLYALWNDPAPADTNVTITLGGPQ